MKILEGSVDFRRRSFDLIIAWYSIVLLGGTFRAFDKLCTRYGQAPLDLK
jgi:hypothetical protein